MTKPELQSESLATLRRLLLRTHSRISKMFNPNNTKAMQATPDNEVLYGFAKIALAWLAYFLGSITLQHVGVFLACVFTFLQILVLLRDKFHWWKPTHEDDAK